MKALIFNSGLGKRMGELTKNSPKSMVKLLNGETIFHRQLRLLKECGITDIVVTTGPFKEQIMEVANNKEFNDMHFTFVENPVYDKTNYIYSMYLAKEYLNDDFITLHGDLVFNKGLLEKVLKSDLKSLVTINRKKALPEKDFKGRIIDGKLQEVSISIFDDNCFALQPMYKLSKDILSKWLEKIDEFIEKGINTVYAENAFNEILPTLSVHEFSYENDFIDEIDNPIDLERVSNEIRYFDYQEQNISFGINSIKDLLVSKNIKNVFIVTTPLFDKWPLKNILDKLEIKYTLFTEYEPNPKYEDLLKGIELFKKDDYDMIISLGGGSSIDIAKAIKLCSNLYLNNKELPKEYEYNAISHLSIPTTAGTGSESTHFAVLYFNGKKYSLDNDMLLPDYVILENSFLLGLPDYQKKSTILDALSQAIESYWSVNSTDVSKSYAREAIRIINNKLFDYLNNNDDAICSKMLYASNLAGRAINISKTTASHAMSYKLSSQYNIPHGQAVFLTLPHLWDYIVNNIDKCIDKRGSEYLEKILQEICESLKLQKYDEVYEKLLNIYRMMNFDDIKATDDEINLLTNSVNIERLKNTPVNLSKEDIEKIYKKALN